MKHPPINLLPPLAAVMLLAATLMPVGCHSPRRENGLGRGTPSLSLRAAMPAPQAGRHAQALVGEALEQYWKTDLKGAQTSLASARQIDLLPPDTYKMEAGIALDIGDPGGHVAALEAMLAAHPRSAPLHNTAGNLLVQAGKPGEGLKALETAVRLSPGTAQYAQDLAAAYLAHGEMHAAEAVLLQTRRHNPQDVGLVVALARLYESAEEWWPALEHYELALRQNPGHLPWRRQRARCLYRLGEDGEAARAFAEYLEEEGAHLSPAELVQYGDACLRIGDFERAQQVFDHVSHNHAGGLKEVELLRGICALKRNDTTGAKHILDAVHADWPQDSNVIQLLRLAAPADRDESGWRPTGDGNRKMSNQ